MRNRVEDISAQLAPFHQLDAGNSKSLLKYFSRVRRVAAGSDSADVADMNEGRAPTHERALMVDRRDDINVRIVNRGEIGIVQQKDIVGKNFFLAEAFDDPLDREAGANHVVA